MKKVLFAGAVFAALGMLILAYWQHDQSAPSSSHSGFREAQQSSSGTSAAPAPPAPTVQDWRVVSVESRVVDSTDIASTYSWKLTIQNDSSELRSFQGEIEFLDADGFVMDRSPAWDHSRPDAEYTTRNRRVQSEQARLLVPAKSQAVFTGIAYLSVAAAAKVARVEARIHKESPNEAPATE